MGNIFKLGTRYSGPLGARYLDEHGDERLIWMGSYGIGPARSVAAAIGSTPTTQGISWPRAIAPFDVELVAVEREGEPARELADRLYDELRAAGLDTLYDDRAASAGEKFADAELLGCPLRLTVGRKSIEAETVDVQVRRGREQRSLALANAAEGRPALARPPLTTRRLLGLDRSGPAPPDAAPCATCTVDDSERDRVRPDRADRPLPRAVALSSGDGRSTPATICSP